MDWTKGGEIETRGREIKIKGGDGGYNGGRVEGGWRRGRIWTVGSG